MVCIYKITSPTNRIYIGQTWNWKKRENAYKNLECKSQRKLYNSLKKYNFEVHKVEILLELSENITQEELDSHEIYWWKFYKDLGFNMLNIREPGSRGKNSEDSKRRMSEIRKGRKISEGTRQAFIKYNTGRIKSEEEKRKISKAHKGKVIPIEMRKRISDKLKGRKIPLNVVEKIKLTKLTRESKSCKKVVDTSNGVIFSSITAASKFYNIKHYDLGNKLMGKVENDTSLIYLINVCREEIFS